MFYGNPGSVPKGVSRKHCKVTVDDEAKVTIEDITDNNFMYINGADCKRKKGLELTDTVELGPTRYRLDLESIVKGLSSNQSYSIAPLKEIYETYEKEKISFQVKQGRLNAISSLPIILTTVSGFLAFLLDGQTVKVVFGLLAGLLLLTFFIIRWVLADKNPKMLKQREDTFREEYVCPNPACRRFLGATPYKELLKNKSCPYCRAKYKE